MDANDARTEQILAYLKGEMEGVALLQFEQQLEADADLQSEVEAYRLVLGEFRKRRYRTFLEEVEGFELGTDPHQKDEFK